jgi:hypothetical protein
MSPSNTMIHTAATSTSTTSNTNKYIVSKRIDETQAISFVGTTPLIKNPAIIKMTAPVMRFSSALFDDVLIAYSRVSLTPYR